MVQQLKHCEYDVHAGLNGKTFNNDDSLVIFVRLNCLTKITIYLFKDFKFISFFNY